MEAVGFLGDDHLELGDSPGQRLQLQHFRSRRLPGLEGHAFEESQDHPRIEGVGLGPLHQSAGKGMIHTVDLEADSRHQEGEEHARNRCEKGVSDEFEETIHVSHPATNG